MKSQRVLQETHKIGLGVRGSIPLWPLARCVGRGLKNEYVSTTRKGGKEATKGGGVEVSIRSGCSGYNEKKANTRDTPFCRVTDPLVCTFLLSWFSSFNANCL